MERICLGGISDLFFVRFPKKKKMKITKKHLKFFKKECDKWIKRFELNNFKVHYFLEDLDGCYAEISINLKGFVASVYLSNDINTSDAETVYSIIKESAKHEMIHLLLAKLGVMSRSREYTAQDCLEAEEEIVRKLEKIIN